MANSPNLRSTMPHLPKGVIVILGQNRTCGLSSHIVPAASCFIHRGRLGGVPGYGKPPALAD
ncbi:hypothetical protein [Profundibacter sp.]